MYEKDLEQSDGIGHSTDCMGNIGNNNDYSNTNIPWYCVS